MLLRVWLVLVWLPGYDSYQIAVLGRYSCTFEEFAACTDSQYVVPSFMLGVRDGGMKGDHIQVGDEKVYIKMYSAIQNSTTNDNFKTAMEILLANMSDTIGIVGMEDTCENIASLTKAFDKMLVTYECSSDVGEVYMPDPTVLQFISTECEKYRAVVSFVRNSGWSNVAVMHFESVRLSDAAERRECMLSTLSTNGITATYVSYASGTYSSSREINRMVYEAHLKARIFIVMCDGLRICQQLVDVMYLAGLLQTEEYYVIAVPLSKYMLLSNLQIPASITILQYGTRWTPSSVLNSEGRSFVVFIDQYDYATATTPEFLQLPTRLYNYMMGKECPLLCGINSEGCYAMVDGTIEVSYVASWWTQIAKAYIAGRTVTSALLGLTNSSVLASGEDLANYIKSTATISDLLGYSASFRNGVSQQEYYLQLARPLTPQQYFFLGGTMTPDLDNASAIEGYKLLLSSNISDWVQSSDALPVDIPPCGFDLELCPAGSPAEVTVICVASAAALILIGVILYLWRWIQYERRLESEYWIIPRSEITLLDLSHFGSSRVGSDMFGSMLSGGRSADGSIVEEDAKGTIEFYQRNIRMASRVKKERRGGVKRMEHLVEDQWDMIEDYQLGRYNGQLITVRKIHKSLLLLTRDMKRELDLLMTTTNENLNKFYGLVNDKHYIFTVHSFAPRKSLNDLLRNVDLRLDRMFKVSFVEDLIRGMRFLHKGNIGYHGNLKSTNCLVDAYWRVKLSNFAMDQIRKDEDRPREDALLWTAPEILRRTNKNLDLPKEDLQLADVYSIGIVLYEIYGRLGPFGDDLLDSKEIVEQLKFPNGEVTRPDLAILQKAPALLLETIRRCWSESPLDRPSVNKIRDKLKPMSQGLRANIADNIMALLDRYRYNLEDIIKERTEELEEERRRNESLLLQMLPKSVAECLKDGRPVEAEFYDSVSIYFSDIVGFTALSSKSTPMQVVNMLNDLYTAFDTIIDKFDCYKVETIGDAYMFVSGLPELNGIHHAGEVASASFELLEHIKVFHVAHYPDEKLRLRIGIHSGSVVTGVVGIRMPRYCLFGDTVITASNMESSGEPMKIQMSVETFKLLALAGGYTTSLRGDMQLKSKEKMRTYWLLSYNKEHRLQRLKSDTGRYQQLTRLIGRQ